MEKTFIKWCKIILLLPLILVWDVTYFIIEKTYQAATWIDNNGGDLIDQFIEEKVTWRK